MSRIIDADALLEIIRTHCRDLWEDVWNFFDGKPHRSRDYLRGVENGYWEIKKDIEQVPTIDAVKVIRCGKCRHYQGNHNVPGCAPCGFWGIGAVMWDDFCKRGERREK